MIFDFYNQFGALNSKNVFRSFETGLKKLGHTVEYHSGKGDVAVIWSVLWNGRMKPNQSVFHHYRNKGKPVIVLEIGALKRDYTQDGSNKTATWKVGINGINRNAFFNNGSNDSSRAGRLGLGLKPWKSAGENILICSQHERSEQWVGMPSSDVWVLNQIKQIRQHTDRPIRIRSHPRSPVRRSFAEYNATPSTGDFQQELNNAWAVVNYCSGPGIEAVLNGTPAFVSPISLAYDVANDIDFYHDIENPLKPDRQQWLNDLAWTEWTQQEMAQGIPQELICKKLV